MKELTIIYKDGSKITETFENRVLLARFIQLKTDEVLNGGALIIETIIRDV